MGGLISLLWLTSEITFSTSAECGLNPTISECFHYFHGDSLGIDTAVTAVSDVREGQ
jgi:hypothetical protein